MNRRHVLIVVRADVAVAVRDAVIASIGDNPLAAIKLRRTADAAGTHSHFCAHGYLPDRLWDDMVAILNTTTQGVRDSVDWQGKSGGGSIANARWAVATDSGDIVAAYRLSAHGATTYENPRDALLAAGFAFTREDQ